LLSREIGKSSLGPLQGFADFLFGRQVAVAAEKWGLCEKRLVRWPAAFYDSAELLDVLLLTV
jgi:hypothetical protein